jgi:methionine-rich copper-binding protein CopC
MTVRRAASETMPKRQRRWFSFSVAVAAVLVSVTSLWIPPIDAHTTLLQASPGRDETVGGTIDFVDLAFFDPVTNATVTVSLNGVPLPGVTTVTDGRVIRFELNEPLTTPGRYEVTYQMISFDSDETASGFFFTYDASAPQPTRIGEDSLIGGEEPADPVEGEDTAIPWVLIGATVVILVALLAMLGIFVSRREPQEWHDHPGGEWQDHPDSDWSTD